MCLTLLHRVNKKGTKNPLASTLSSCFFTVAMNSHTEFFPTDLILYSVQSGFSLEITYFQIQWSTPPTWIQMFLLHLHCPSTFICFSLHQTSLAFCLFIRHSTHYSTPLLLSLSHFLQRIPRLHPLPMPFLFQLPYLFLPVIFASTFSLVYSSITELFSAV